MKKITNWCLQDIVELDGDHYLVSSTIDDPWGRGHETKVKACDPYGREYRYSKIVCHVYHAPTLYAVEKGRADIISNLAQYIADYKAKQEKERMEREEQERKARETISRIFQTFTLSEEEARQILSSYGRHTNPVMTRTFPTDNEED